MTRETPTYERKIAVPGSDNSRIHSGAQAAFTQAAAAMQTGVTAPGAFDRFIADYSQESANKMARDAGAKAATQPGQTFFGIGESGKHFVDAYKREELQVASYNGNDALKKIYGLADREKNPNGQTLEDYRANGLEAIEQIVSELPPEEQPKMRRSLLESYTIGEERLQKKVADHDFETLKQQSSLAYLQKTQMMNELALEGYGKDAERYKEESLQIIQNAEELKLITPAQAFEKRTTLEKQLQLSIINGEALYVAKNGNAPEWLRELATTDRLESVSPELRSDIIESARRTINAYDSSLASSRFIDMAEAQQEAENGFLTPERLEYYKERLGAEDSARLMHTVGKQTAKAAAIQEKNLQIATYSNSPVWLGTNSKPEDIEQYSNSILQEATEKSGRNLSLQEQAQLFSGLKADNPVLKKEFTSAMISNDPSLMKDASFALEYLSRVNPNAINSVSEKHKALALQISELIKGGSLPETAIATATKNIVGLSDQDLEKREKEISGGDLFKKYRDVDLWSSNAADITGFDKSIIPGGMAYDVFNQLKAGYMIHGDLDMAKKYAAAATKRIWGETRVNGYPEIMKTPPDLLMPGGDSIVREQLERQVQSLSEASKAAFEKGDTEFYYEFRKGKPMQYALDITELREEEAKELVGEKQSLRKIYRDNILPEERYEILLKSDQYTITPPESGPYSYFVALKDSKGIGPLENPMNGKMERFVIDAKEQRDRIEKERAEFEKQEIARRKSIESMMKEMKSLPTAQGVL